MRQGLRLIVSLLIIAAISQACARRMEPQESCNFVQNSNLQRVSASKSSPLRFYVHSSVPQEAYPAIEAAIQTWNSAIGGKNLITIVAWGSGGGAPARDGYSTIYWSNTWEPNKPNEQARTTIYWTNDQIYEADIRLNDFHFDFYLGSDPVFNGVDLQSLIVHELGHALGLSHISSQQSVMEQSLASGKPRRELEKVDIDSLRCEY